MKFKVQKIWIDGLKQSKSKNHWLSPNKETDEDGKKRGVSMERSKADTNEKKSPDGLSGPNQNAIIINTNIHIYTY